MFNTPVKFALVISVAAALGGQYLSRQPADGLAEAVRLNPAAKAPAIPPGNVPAANLQPTGMRTELLADSSGHFYASVEIEYRSVQMLVDTGASIIALTYEDADRLGVRPDSSGFTIPIATANGTAKAAPVKLRSVRVSGINVYDVEAVVMPRGAMSQSLLGMSYLRRLASFEIGNGKLTLRQ